MSKEYGVWLSGARFFGIDIPEVTWDNVQTEPQIEEEADDSLLKTPAELISVVVRAAIELRQDKALMPEWLAQAINHPDQNMALRALVEKKLGQYHETALSYADLRKRANR